MLFVYVSLCIRGIESNQTQFNVRFRLLVLLYGVGKLELRSWYFSSIQVSCGYRCGSAHWFAYLRRRYCVHLSPLGALVPRRTLPDLYARSSVPPWTFSSFVVPWIVRQVVRQSFLATTATTRYSLPFWRELPICSFRSEIREISVAVPEGVHYIDVCSV